VDRWQSGSGSVFLSGLQVSMEVERRTGWTVLRIRRSKEMMRKKPRVSAAPPGWESWGNAPLLRGFSGVISRPRTTGGRKGIGGGPPPPPPPNKGQGKTRQRYKFKSGDRYPGGRAGCEKKMKMEACIRAGRIRGN